MGYIFWQTPYNHCMFTVLISFFRQATVKVMGHNYSPPHFANGVVFSIIKSEIVSAFSIWMNQKQSEQIYLHGQQCPCSPSENY